ncbi:hypothetical protein [Crateriforma conspicua]|uniref:hypothetical protein n=1 Tax=Crateriforma conspicua TaxID=2527996 RepID=UPI0011A7E64D|nr:hypothetical protein [Crateriforma conspicua]
MLLVAALMARFVIQRSLRSQEGLVMPPRVRLAVLSISSLFVLSTFVQAGQRSASQRENPVYTAWEAFPVGTKVVVRSVTERDGKQQIEKTSKELLEKTDEAVVIGRTVVMVSEDGSESKLPQMKLRNPHYFRLPPGIDPKQFGQAKGVKEQGEQRLQVEAGTFETTWKKIESKVEAGITYTQTWSSNEVPGGLVKAINRTPATEVINTMELITLEIPGQSSTQ